MKEDKNGVKTLGHQSSVITRTKYFQKAMLDLQRHIIIGFFSTLLEERLISMAFNVKELL